MADNKLKTPLYQTLSTVAQQKALDAIQLEGKSLPATVVSVNNYIVTVSFSVTSPYTLPNVTIPMMGPRYIHYPIQVGDKGVVVAADSYLGGMSGLGGGVADLSQRANLTALFFVPLGNTGFAATDPNAVTVTAPNGVALKDDTGASIVTLTPTSIVLSSGGHTMTIDGAGITLDGIVWLTHVHPGITIGPNDTQPPA